MEVLERPATTHAGRTEARKVGMTCPLLCSDDGLLANFPVLTSFTSGVSWLGCNFLFLHYCSEPLLIYFLASARTDHGRARCEVVASISRKLLDVTTRPATTLVGRTEDPKSVLFSALYCFCGDFLGNFSATTGSSSGIYWLGFVLGGEGSPLDMVEWPVVHHAGRKVGCFNLLLTLANIFLTFFPGSGWIL